MKPVEPPVRERLPAEAYELRCHPPRPQQPRTPASETRWIGPERSRAAGPRPRTAAPAVWPGHPAAFSAGRRDVRITAPGPKRRGRAARRDSLRNPGPRRSACTSAGSIRSNAGPQAPCARRLGLLAQPGDGRPHSRLAVGVSTHRRRRRNRLGPPLGPSTLHSESDRSRRDGGRAMKAGSLGTDERPMRFWLLVRGYSSTNRQNRRAWAPLHLEVSAQGRPASERRYVLPTFPNLSYR